MKETPVSNCEKEFILTAITERKRLDGREIYDYRRIEITFGVDRGCVQVQLGKTRVLAQVSCEVTSPKQSRPSEGILFVNVELSPMASPAFEPGRQSDYGVELNRLLERCIKESRCVDTESLCIMAGIKVWQIRCDVHVLNHDGNLIDCTSMAAIAALTHFRRPDITVSGEDIVIHTLEDRDPIPLSVHHMPLCVTFAFYQQGQFLLVDPCELEERVMEGKVVVGMNKHREVCALQTTGSMLLLKDQILRCTNIAVVKVTEMTSLIQEALKNDTAARAAGKKFGFAASVVTKKVTANEREADAVSMDHIAEAAKEIAERGSESSEEEMEKKPVRVIGKGTATIGHGGVNTWAAADIEDEEMEDERIEELKQADKKSRKTHKKQIEDTGELSGDSEEEVVLLQSTDMQISAKPEAQAQSDMDVSVPLKKDKNRKKTKAKKNK